MKRFALIVMGLVVAASLGISLAPTARTEKNDVDIYTWFPTDTNNIVYLHTNTENDFNWVNIDMNDGESADTCIYTQASTGIGPANVSIWYS